MDEVTWHYTFSCVCRQHMRDVTMTADDVLVDLASYASQQLGVSDTSPPDDVDRKLRTSLLLCLVVSATL